jgi:hypothetical protein
MNLSISRNFFTEGAIMKRRNRPLGFESLEQRQMLAGNITASVSEGGQLLLRGDWQQNEFIAWKGVVEGRVIVSGGKDYSGRNTAVNGSFAPQVFDGVTNIRADMYGANTNRALFTNLVLPDLGFGARSIVVGMGHGNDQVVIAGDVGRPLQFERNDGAPIPYGPVDLGGPVYVAGGPGNDVFSVVNAAFGGQEKFVSGFDGGSGNDAFYVDGSISQNRIGYTRLIMGDGDDLISVKRAQIPWIEVSRGSYTNVLGGPSHLDFLNIQGNGIDIRHRNSSASVVNINNAQGFISVGGGGLNRDVTVRNVNAKQLAISGGTGDDRVAIFDSLIEQFGRNDILSVVLSDGDDELTLQNVIVRGSGSVRETRLDGGAGNDRLIDLGGNDLGVAAISGFES